MIINILGETLQRMDDESARYSLVLPDLPQFRNLWERLPRLVKTLDCVPQREIQLALPPRRILTATRLAGICLNLG